MRGKPLLFRKPLCRGTADVGFGKRQGEVWERRERWEWQGYRYAMMSYDENGKIQDKT